MPDPTPIDVVRGRFPSTGSDDEAELLEYARHLDQLRDRVKAEDLHEFELALTFDPRGGESND